VIRQGCQQSDVCSRDTASLRAATWCKIRYLERLNGSTPA
jgi:hypothetical protein